MKTIVAFTAGASIMGALAFGSFKQQHKKMMRVSKSNGQLLDIIRSYAAHTDPEVFEMVKLDTEFMVMADNMREEGKA